MRLHTTQAGVHMDDVLARQAAEAQRILAARVALVAAIDDVLAQPGVVCITGVGYTPEWNDGEECTHRQRVYLNHQGVDDVVLRGANGVPIAYAEPDYYRDEAPDWPWAAIDEAMATPPAKADLRTVSRLLPDALGTDWCLYADGTGIYVGPHRAGY